MSRPLALLLIAAGLAACGHYGPPERQRTPAAAPAGEVAHVHDDACTHEEAER